MPSTYRFLNADHSLVARDDHVIAWPAQGAEDKMWKDAGSPAPAEMTGPVQRNTPPIEPPMPMPMPWTGMPPVQDLFNVREVSDALTQVEDAVSHADTVADLKKQVARLTHLVHEILSVQSGEPIK